MSSEGRNLWSIRLVATTRRMFFLLDFQAAKTNNMFHQKRDCMWMFPEMGAPKWMVYFMENPINKWMIWGGTPHSKKKTSICVLQVLYTNSFADSGTMC